MDLNVVFEFATSNRIIFGIGAVEKIPSFVKDFGNRALLVCGGGSVPIDRISGFLDDSGVSYEVFRVEDEPDIEVIESGISLARTSKCEFVISFGGGSVLDTGKAISALMTNQGDLMGYLEVIGGGKKIENPPAPMMAIPTTAGTGTEVTRNAVISSPEHHVKVSMRSPMMIPTVALVDPEVTLTMPPSVTASTGMDALTQVIEGYVSNKANPMTDALARDGILRGSRSLLQAYKNGNDLKARYDMSLTSLFGGLVLGNSGLGAVHGFAGPIGGMFQAPHGVICASLLPYVMKYNAIELSEFEGLQDVQSKYQDIAKWVTGEANARIEDGVQWIAMLAHQLHIPRLREIGIKKEDFERIIEKSKVSSSMQKNPIKLRESTLAKILEEAY